MYSAEEDAISVKDDNVPAHLKNYEFATKEDKLNKANYKYPHDFGGYVGQQYLPDSLKGRVYYKPKDNGYEKVVKEIRKRKGKKD
jgi:putative ATPase